MALSGSWGKGRRRDRRPSDTPRDRMSGRGARAPKVDEEDTPKKRPGRAAPVREDRKGVADYFGDFPFFIGLKPVIFSTSSVA